MSLVDHRGRVLGRYNLVDVAVAVVVLGLIPLGYGAYALFRTPLPQLTAVEPTSRQFEPEFRVVVKGENLRPYMRVSLNDMQGRSFLFKSASSAEVVFGDIPPGTYDVVLYDNEQERSRLPKFFTLTPAALPPAQLDLAGFLTSLTASQVDEIKVGSRFPGAAEVLAVGKAAPDMARVVAGDKPVEISIPKTQRVPALLRVNCDVVSGPGGFGACVADKLLGPGVYLELRGATGRVPFLITEVRPPDKATQADIRIKLTADPAFPFIKAGDSDVGYWQNEFSGGATVVSAPASSSGEMTLRVPAYPTSTGWTYAGQPLRVGAPLLFVSARYQLTGMITSVPPLPDFKR
jgi:hypothetical protein